MGNDEETLMGLYELRTILLNKKIHYENNLNIIDRKLKDINVKLCEYEGHDFSEWFDADNCRFCWARTCSRCNTVEYSYEKPKILQKK